MNEEYQKKLNELKEEIESLKDMHEKDQIYIASQKQLITALKQVRDVQRCVLNGNNSDYNIGFYNGMELALSILYEVPPEYAKRCSEVHVDDREIAKDIRKHAYMGL